MESNALPESLAFVLAMLAIFVPYAFFLTNRNAKLKRRLWPAYAIGTSIVIVALFWLMGEPNAFVLYLVVPLFAVGALINLLAVKFCDACGATINNLWRAASLLPPARACPECGASLQRRAALSTEGSMTRVPLTPRDQAVPAGSRSQERTVLMYGGLPGAAGVVLVVLVFYFLGVYTVYGLEYLQFLPSLISTDWLRLAIFSSLFCLLYHPLTWRQTAPRGLAGGSALLARDTRIQAVGVAAATLAALALIYILLQHYFHAWCLYLRAPFLVGTAALVVPILGAGTTIGWLRRQSKIRTAFAVLLVSDAAVSFAWGQVLTLDHFRKGLQKYTQGFEQSDEIASSPSARFFIDYTRKEFALVWPSDGNPKEHRRAFPPELCQ
jgi:hypothetical protein